MIKKSEINNNLEKTIICNILKDETINDKNYLITNLKESRINKDSKIINEKVINKEKIHTSDKKLDTSNEINNKRLEDKINKKIEDKINISDELINKKIEDKINTSDELINKKIEHKINTSDNGLIKK